MKRNLLILLGTILIPILIMGALSSPTAEKRDPLVIHRQAVVVDTHSDTLMRVLEERTWLPKVDLGRRTGFHIDIPGLQEGEVDVPYFGCFTIPMTFPDGRIDYSMTNSRLLSLMNGFHWTLRQNQDTIGQVRTFQDIARLRNEGRIAAVLSIEGAYSLNPTNAIELLRQYDDLGVRAIALTWNISNALGEGTSGRYIDESLSEPGLTPLGKAVVKEMNRLGIIVDVSHLNTATFWDVISTTDAPIIASHSAASGLRPHVRNLNDDQLKAIAKNRGVVQVVFYGEFLTADGDRTVKKIVDHIDYIVNLIGIDHVGLGSDFDGADMPLDLPNCAAMPEITKELIARGYSTADITKILGGNSLRVMQEVWSRAPKSGGPQAPIIQPSLAMGEFASDSSPTLTARLTLPAEAKLDPASVKVILDGIVLSPEFNPSTGEITLRHPEPLRPNYHVVTFTASSINGQTARETRVFYIQGE